MLGKFFRLLGLVLLLLAIPHVVITPASADQLRITTLDLPQAYAGVPYDVKLHTNLAESPWFEWAIKDGTLPPGLKLEQVTGWIIGTPTSTGTYTFTLRVEYHEPDFGPQDIAEKTFTLQVLTASTTATTSAQPMQFACSVNPTTMTLDTTDVAAGKSSVVTGYFNVEVDRTGGDLWEYVTVTVTSPREEISVFPAEWGGIPSSAPFVYTFKVTIINWQDLQGNIYYLQVGGKTAENTCNLSEAVEVKKPSLPDLILIDVYPVTQRGYDLVQNKETQFMFKYAQPSDFTGDSRSSNVTAWVELRLPKAQWDFEWDKIRGVDPFTFRFRDEGGFHVFERQFLFPLATTSVPTELSFFPSNPGFFYPKPTSSNADYELRLDSHNDVMESDETNNQMVKSRGVPYQASKLDLAWVMFDWDGQLFTEQDYFKAVDFWYTSQPPAPERYLPAIFPIKQLNVYPSDHWLQWYSQVDWYRQSANKWDAHDFDKVCEEIIPGNDFSSEAAQIAEMAQEANFDRVVAITPNNLLTDRLCQPTDGVVFPSSWWYGDSGMVAFVELNYATSAFPPDAKPFIPVVAHELSHTFGFPDIYGDHCSKDPKVEYPWIYFDPADGGIIENGKSGWPDIMACTGLPDIQYWSSHSYQSVHDGLKRFGDPPEGLLVSMMLYKNGTVVPGPFERLIDHTYPFPQTEGRGNYNLVLLGKDGAVLQSYPMNVTFSIFTDPGGQKPVGVVPIVGMVEYSENLGAVELTDANGQVLMRRQVSAHTPQLNVIAPAPGTDISRGESYTLKWECTDEDGGPLWYSVLLREKGDRVWSSLAHFTSATTFPLTVPNDAKLGDYELEVIATDGVNTDIRIVPFSIRETLTSQSTESHTTTSTLPSPSTIELTLLATFLTLGTAAVIVVRRRRDRSHVPLTPRTRYCGKCGAVVEPTKNFCGKCGARAKWPRNPPERNLGS